MFNEYVNGRGTEEETGQKGEEGGGRLPWVPGWRKDRRHVSRWALDGV